MMKKILCILLCTCLLTALVACGGAKNETLKFGVGVDVSASFTAATEDAAGKANSTVTVAAVLVDNAGKIVKCAVDTVETKGTFDVAGKATAPTTPVLSKYEQGDSYNMVEYGKAQAEWYKQADAFCKLVEGKTAAEVKALVAEGDKGADEVINAGCTIMIAEFVRAIDKAVKNAADSAATAASDVSVAVFVEASSKDATEDADGQHKYETTVIGAALDGGKITVSVSDCAQTVFKFGADGSKKAEPTTATKREQGDAYNMVLYGSAKAEWYKQADAFDAALVGKTAGEVSALMGADNYGNADLQAANCTILVNGFVGAASKLK